MRPSTCIQTGVKVPKHIGNGPKEDPLTQWQRPFNRKELRGLTWWTISVSKNQTNTLSRISQIVLILSEPIYKAISIYSKVRITLCNPLCPLEYLSPDVHFLFLCHIHLIFVCVCLKPWTTLIHINIFIKKSTTPTLFVLVILITNNRHNDKAELLTMSFLTMVAT